MQPYPLLDGTPSKHGVNHDRLDRCPVTTNGNSTGVSGLLSMIVRVVLAMIALACGPAAIAQSTFTYVNGTDGAINGSTICSAPLVRNFSVPDSFTVSDVEIGVFATHAWRGDIRITLQAPDLTRVQIVNGNGSVSGDNFNVRLNDSGTGVVNTDGNTANHSTANPPPFQHNFTPNNALSAFNGVSSNGIWRLEICDIFPGADNGTFRHAELYLTSVPPATGADLSLNKTVSNTAPANGTAITYTLEVSSAATSPQTATGVTVRDLLPPGADYVSHSGPGSYNPGTGVWTVGSVAPGQTRTLTIQATVNATSGATVTNIAEVTASSVSDPDSTPNNGASGEDDYDTASFTVTGTRTAGIPPTLFCPAGTNLFDWDSRTWAAGSLNNSYAMPGFGTVNFAITSNGTFISDAGFGGQNPALASANTGGLAPAQLSLHQYLDFSNIFETATTVITLPNGIAGAQFTIFDIDFIANDFADKVTVTGSYKGATVLPTLTNGVANYVSGNIAIGDVGANNNTVDGDVVVTFSSAIDTITIVYGNHTTAPAVPDGQAMAIHDFTFCAPATDVSVLKTSMVFSDPVNDVTNPKAIPGSVMDYNILVSNTGISDADSNSIVVTDNVPSETKFCLTDLDGPGSGPIRFTDGGTSSALTYTFTALGNGADDLEFSNDSGATYTYTPTPDGDGCDGTITNFRVSPNGAFSGGGSFTLQARFIIE